MVDVGVDTLTVWRTGPPPTLPGSVSLGSLASMPPTDAPTTTPGPSVGERGDVEKLAARFRLLADGDFAGYCPAYDRIARALADEDDALGLLIGLVPVNRTPVLSLAATHDLVLADPGGELAAIYRGDLERDPWPAFRALLYHHTDQIRDLMATRSIQTNEVGRTTALLPALATVTARQRAGGDERGLALLEIGPSAGLNLALDRFRFTYTDGNGDPLVESGPASSPLHLLCDVRGVHLPPMPSVPLRIALREGIDLEPIDVDDDDACRWLSACLWPGIPDRSQRLATAIAIARCDPPRLHEGNAVTDLARHLDDIGGEFLPVVLSTWALAYVDPEGRQSVVDTIDAIGASRDLAFVTAEAPGVTPWVPTADERSAEAAAGAGAGGGDGTTTVVGLRHWRDAQVSTDALGFMHPHGRWLAWLTGETP